MKLRIEAGALLAAAPDMLDRNFMHSVVLVCRHSEEGAFGLVVNRPADVTVDMLLPEHPLLRDVRYPVHRGGPVGLDTLQFLHRVPELIPDGIPVADGLWLGGDLDALARHLSAHTEAARADVRLLLGYSGWGAGQLESELETGSWIPASLQAELVFEEDPQATWRRVVRSIGREGAGLEILPPDVSWN